MPDKKLKEEVLGAAEKIKADKKYIVTSEIIQQPLVENGTVARACCVGCGYCLEIVENGAKYLAELCRAEIPGSWTGYYFEVEKCIVCSDNYKNIKLNRIF